MGKRSSFERLPRDFYATPIGAALPLVPFLHGIRSFAEPCSGDGALVRHLEGEGLRCVYTGDISAGQDAFAFDNYGNADAIITNPPYIRALMCRLIEHFLRVGPITWLLLPADWSHNLHAAPFVPSCTDVVSIGRVRWFEGTTMNSMDNFAWYRFDARHSAGPILHARNSTSVSSRASLCAQCGKPYRPQRSDALTCSNACRQRAYRVRPKRNVSVTHGDA